MTVHPVDSVVPMRWWHVEAVAALECRLFAADAWSAEAFWAELAQSESRYYLVAKRGDQVRGYGGLVAVPGGPDADVMTLAVDPADQGHGLGTRLLRELLAEAKRRRCATVFLDVKGGNATAVRLYERHGFERVSVRRGYYADGDDAVVMRRSAKEAL